MTTDEIITEITERLSNLEDSIIDESQILHQRIFLVRIVKNLENISLRSVEKRELEGLIMKFIDALKFGPNNELYSSVKLRFSYDFFPGISLVPVNNFESKERMKPNQNDLNDTNTIDNNNNYNYSNDIDVDKSDQNFYSSKKNDTNLYYTCLIKRHQSTLWTSFRLYLESVKEFDQDGNEINKKVFDEAKMLFGAKKLKSGMSGSCLIWKSVDSKFWKEKDAYGKILKNQSKYFGSVISSHLEKQDDSSEQGIAIFVNNRGLDKIIHLTAVINKHNPEHHIENLQLLDSRQHHNINPVSDIPENKSNFYQITNKSNSDSNVTNSLMNELEHVLQNHGKLSPENENQMLVLRSKLPRKIQLSGGKKKFNAVTYADDSRVKVASRKNIVVDTIVSDIGSSVNTEWSSDTRHAPILQVL